MPEHFDVFPASTVAALKAQLDESGPAQLKVFREHGHLMLQVLPLDAPPTSATSLSALAGMTFPALDDSFPCPGSPGCPPV